MCDAHTDADGIQLDIIKSLICKSSIKLWDLYFEWEFEFCDYMRNVLCHQTKITLTVGGNHTWKKNCHDYQRSFVWTFTCNFSLKEWVHRNVLKLFLYIHLNVLTIRLWTTSAIPKSNTMEWCFDAWFHSQFGAVARGKPSKAEQNQIFVFCSNLR